MPDIAAMEAAIKENTKTDYLYQWIESTRQLLCNGNWEDKKYKHGLIFVVILIADGRSISN